MDSGETIRMPWWLRILVALRGVTRDRPSEVHAPAPQDSTFASAMVVDPDELDTMVRTLYGECRGESLLGQRAVAWVIRNRADYRPPAWWGQTIGSVCLKHSRYKGREDAPKVYQFSCWSDAAWNASNKAQMLALKAVTLEYGKLKAICEDVLAGRVADPTEGATHYRRIGTPARWADRAVVPPIKINHHEFFRLGPSA